MIGKIVEKYKILKELGSGGMGSVYLAKHITIGTKVAIKALHKHLFKNESIKQRFLREAKMQAILDHPNITKVIDFIDNELGLFIVLEFIEGEELDKYLFRTKGLMPEKDAKHYMSKILDAVGYAHSKGIIHRDLKSANIMITPNGGIKIMDFGIAKLSDESLSLTKTGSRLGSPLYMSPEQVTRKKGQSIDHRSDIYSLGVVFHEMLTGKPIYDQNNTSEYEIYDKIVKEPLPRLKTYYKLISDHAQNIVDKATSKEKKDRFQSCLEFKQALEQNENIPIKSVPEKNKKTNYSIVFGIILFLIGISSTAYFLINNNSDLSFSKENQNENTSRNQLENEDNTNFDDINKREYERDTIINDTEKNKLTDKEYQNKKIAAIYNSYIQIDSIKNLTKYDTLVFRKIHNNYGNLIYSLKELQTNDSLFKETLIIEEELHYIKSLDKYYIALNLYNKQDYENAANMLKNISPSNNTPYIFNLKQDILIKQDSIATIAINKKKRIQKKKRMQEKTDDTDVVNENEQEQQIRIPSNLTIQMADRAPIYPGCEGKTGISLIRCTTSQINNYIKSHIDFDNLKGQNLPKGSYLSVIKFIITSQGKTSNVSIQNSNPIIRSEVKRVVKSLPYMSPALYENVNVPIHYKLTLTLSIQ